MVRDGAVVAGSARGPRRIAIVVPSLRVGGTERQVVELVRGLRDAGQDPVIGVLEPVGELLADLERTGARVTPLGGIGPLRVPRNLLALHRLVRRENVTTVYSFLSPSNFVASLHATVSRGHRVVWGVRDDRIGAERTGVGRRAAAVLTRALVRRAAGVIVNGSAVRDALIAFGVPPGRIRVVPNSIDQHRFTPSTTMRAEVRNELALAPDRPVVICLARIAPKKRHADVIDAFAIVRREVPDSVLLIAGSGMDEYVDTLRSRVDALALADHVRFLGERQDAERLFNAADVTVLLSEAEGFPNSIAESLACGTPCVATPVGDVPALVPAANLVGVGEIVAAAERITAVLGETRGSRATLLPPGYGRAELVENTLAALASLTRPGHDDEGARAEHLRGAMAGVDRRVFCDGIPGVEEAKRAR